MNRCIAGFNGFTDWSKTFGYTDTDSMFIHNDQFLELQENIPNIIGSNLGQFHDDITEVKHGKIIRAGFHCS